MEVAFASTPSEIVTIPALEPAKEEGATAAASSAPVTTDTTPVESTAVSAVLTSPPPLSASAQALDELVDSFVESFRFIQNSLLEESAFRAQIQTLESLGFIKELPEAVKNLRLLKGTLPIKLSQELESGPGSEEQLGHLITSVFTLINNLKQCLTHSLRNPVITFMEFAVGDIALFMPLHTDNRKVWIAFNSNSPYHFLADVSYRLFICVTN